MASETKVDTYMPFFCGDFLAGTLGWSAEERGHYTVLLSVQWIQGSIPSDMAALERISSGVTSCWATLSQKFPVWEDGLRRNRRLESHREKSIDLKEAKSRAGKAGNEQRWKNRKTVADGSQTDRTAIANGIANGIAKTSPPTPTPTSNYTHTQPRVRVCRPDEEQDSGWALDAWTKFSAAWNSTERAAPWNHLTPPNDWADLAASPGWIERAMSALAMLPSRRYFDRPLPVTRFFEYVDRILADEFADPKGSGSPRERTAKAPRRGNL
jgi:uncharacterized protein YdaU (DUF1376 family)